MNQSRREEPSDTYRTVGDGARAETKVDGSRFIAEAIPVRTREEVDETIEAVRQREHQATHHCTAYRLGQGGDDFHYDDDGEPSGTAGAPILRQIDGRDLTNVLVVVTRYYGGTKLGTGGLMRAYGDAASYALDAAPIATKVIRVPVRLRFSYEDTSPASRVLKQFDVEVRERDYTDVTELTAAVRRSQADAFVQAFTNALGGRGDVRTGGAES